MALLSAPATKVLLLKVSVSLVCNFSKRSVYLQPQPKQTMLTGFTGPLNIHSGNYTFNYTTTQTTEPTGVNITGLLTYLLVGGNFEASSPMQLDPVVTSNVAVPLLQPSDEGQVVAFDADNKLVILRSSDDTKPLPNYSSTPLSNWYACTTDSGYLYQTLAWVVGTETAVPQNPTCQKVEVVRVFV